MQYIEMAVFEWSVLEYRFLIETNRQNIELKCSLRQVDSDWVDCCACVCWTHTFQLVLIDDWCCCCIIIVHWNAWRRCCYLSYLFIMNKATRSLNKLNCVLYWACAFVWCQLSNDQNCIANWTSRITCAWWRQSMRRSWGNSHFKIRSSCLNDFIELQINL